MVWLKIPVVLCCANTVVKVWLGLGGKSTWLGLGKDHVRQKIHGFVDCKMFDALYRKYSCCVAPEKEAKHPYVPLKTSRVVPPKTEEKSPNVSLKISRPVEQELNSRLSLGRIRAYLVIWM